MEFSNHHMMSSGGSTFYKIWIMSTLLGSSQEITEDHLNDFTKILSLENNVLSGEIPKRLKNVSNVIARSGKSKEFQKLTPKECLPWLQKHVPEAEKQFQEILKEHGHRGIMEFDMYYEPWSLNPTPLLEALQSTSHMELTNTERGEVNIKNLINSLKTPKSFISKLFLRYLIPKLQSCIRSREFTKSALILVGHKFRLAFRHLGYLLEKEGKLPNANLIFFLTKYELNELIHENKTELLEKAARRQKLYPQLNKITYEEYNYGRPEPIPDVISTIDLESDCTLKGTAVYPGLIQGRACVITDISQAHLIQPNDILITTATDVGWSPYFPMISGLVTEIGGLISHGAVIAREYGIPCVIGVKGATRMFATDNQLILDANKGNISRVITKDQ
ncbi:prodigiosin synthesizing transferase PigC-like [Chrysoperla carnea]|uniref:prodigiosin synthesizing transferase PigC-like n=1 Tax=Chrysoperla carnea TaxID=189513 RepID=UPI001D05DC6B|nr:prodigiosin synthesizing transferase PigC-like [Chrysoperla carnea]